MDSHLAPATDVGQTLGPRGGARGGFRWPNVVVSGWAAERVPRAHVFFFKFFIQTDFYLYQILGILHSQEVPDT